MTPERENTTRSIRLRLRNPRYDRIVRLNTESIARRMGFTEDQIFDITLAVEEAYTNAIEHSRGSHDPLELEIIYHLFHDRLVVSIQDSGCGFEHHIPERDDQGPATEHIRGRGLGLILNLSDHAEILSEPGLGTMIRITKYLTGSPRLRAGDPPTLPACSWSSDRESSVDPGNKPHDTEKSDGEKVE